MAGETRESCAPVRNRVSTPAIQNLERLLGTPRDGALLRYSLGNEYLKLDDAAKAAAYFQAAVERDPQYSAAWKQLGHALLAIGRARAALDAWQRGIQVAERRGDKQAAKEMTVFARRVQKQLESE